MPDAESSSRRLRSATVHLHQRVEDGVDILRRAETLSGYVALLRHMEAFYRAIEPALPLSDGRTGRLRADLDMLDPGWVPEADVEPPRFEKPARALGALYVIEGAALGGLIIARFLHERHGLTLACGASFFGSGGEPVGPRWKAVRALLDAEKDIDAMEAGAVATFLAFERTLVQEPSLV